MTLKNGIKVFAAPLVLLLSGCAGSPVHTAGLNSDEIKRVSDSVLCRTATIHPEDKRLSTPTVMGEVKRRGVDCDAMMAKEKAEKDRISAKFYGPKTTDAKITQNNSEECKGIIITGVGTALYDNIVPYIYVTIKNNSGVRKKLTLDVNLRNQGRTYFGAYDNDSWTEINTGAFRPGQELEIKVKLRPEKGEFLQEIALAECHR